MCATPYDVLCQQELELHEFAKQYTTVLNSNIKLEKSPVAGTHTHTHTHVEPNQWILIHKLDMEHATLN